MNPKPQTGSVLGETFSEEEKEMPGVRARLSLGVCLRWWQLEKLEVLRLCQDKHSDREQHKRMTQQERRAA